MGTEITVEVHGNEDISVVHRNINGHNGCAGMVELVTLLRVWIHGCCSGYRN